MASTPAPSGTTPARTPVFLLKTKSTPGDAYQDVFSAQEDFDPIFVPVLEHRFLDEGMTHVRALLHGRRITRESGGSYGGLIFTSQRAVEAFSKLVKDGPASAEDGWPHLQDLPIYSVGPATTRALRAVPQVPPLEVLGEHTGNGDALAQFILQDYTNRYRDRAEKPSLLFMVGEQRRDVIPKTLMDESLPPESRIKVDEVVVYGTGVMESFGHEFAARLRETADRARRWVVVFSPTGCESMLCALGVLNEAGRANAMATASDRDTFIATIGPTTQSFLVTRFGLEPDVCAARPSPEGVWEAIIRFETNRIDSNAGAQV
ncbi:tetrapyrrole biosynthesis, uroporphyrinogen III synthase [Thozetella sp. PMI_491]|nr:tetrapyrrole biosynthesis, uroporphyrinogen III synthase [Thozetella sp. PMI_491]